MNDLRKLATSVDALDPAAENRWSALFGRRSPAGQVAVRWTIFVRRERDGSCQAIDIAGPLLTIPKTTACAAIQFNEVYDSAAHGTIGEAVWTVI